MLFLLLVSDQLEAPVEVVEPVEVQFRSTYASKWGKATARTRRGKRKWR